MLFVVRDRLTNRHWLKNALEEMKAHKLKGVGLVINAVRHKKEAIWGMDMVMGMVMVMGTAMAMAMVKTGRRGRRRGRRGRW